MPIIYAILAGIGLGYATDKKNEIPKLQGPPTFNDWADRRTWFNPVGGTNVDQYLIGIAILGSLYFIGKKY